MTVLRSPTSGAVDPGHELPCAPGSAEQEANLRALRAAYPNLGAQPSADPYACGHEANWPQPRKPAKGKTHLLKCWPGPFKAIREGRKHHEVRVNDRGYAEGDRLVLSEWEQGRGFSGETAVCDVTYITTGGSFGLPENLCVMSIEMLRGSEL
jgi:hypothetical protein